MTKSRYWIFSFLNIFVSIAVAIFSFAVCATIGAVGVFTVAIIPLLFIPWICATVDRLHNVGQSGWYVVLLLASIFFFIISLFVDSDVPLLNYGLTIISAFPLIYVIHLLCRTEDKSEDNPWLGVYGQTVNDDYKSNYTIARILTIIGIILIPTGVGIIVIIVSSIFDKNAKKYRDKTY